MDTKSSATLSLKLIVDASESVFDAIEDWGHPPGFEFVSDWAIETFAQVKQDSNGSTVLEGPLSSFVEEPSSWGCGVDQRDPQQKKWSSEGSEYYTHSILGFEEGPPVEEGNFAEFWSEFVAAIHDFNTLADGIGRLVIADIASDKNLIFVSRNEVTKTYSIIEDWFRNNQSSRNVEQVGNFLDTVISPDSVENDYLWLFMAELLACLPDLKSIELKAIQMDLEDQLTNGSFVFNKTGFEHLSWLRPWTDWIDD